jgi:hypothetical protein
LSDTTSHHSILSTIKNTTFKIWWKQQQHWLHTCQLQELPPRFKPKLKPDKEDKLSNSSNQQLELEILAAGVQRRCWSRRRSSGAVGSASSEVDNQAGGGNGGLLPDFALNDDSTCE